MVRNLSLVGERERGRWEEEGEKRRGRERGRGGREKEREGEEGEKRREREKGRGGREKEREGERERRSKVRLYLLYSYILY